MTYPVYSIRDEKTTFLPPEVAQNDDQMMRNFAMMVHSPSSPVGFAPRDFALYKIGEFNTETGYLSPVVPIQLICWGSDLEGEFKHEK